MNFLFFTLFFWGIFLEGRSAENPPSFFQKSVRGFLTEHRPNFLLLFPDQWRGDYVDGFPLGNGKILHMPHLRNLSNSGVSFVHAFTPSPLCTPARSSLAVGRTYDRISTPTNAFDFPFEHPTFYRLLRKHGYHVMSAGKDDLTHESGVGNRGLRHAHRLGFSDSIRCVGKKEVVRFSTPRDPYGHFLSSHTIHSTNAWKVLKKSYRNHVGKNGYKNPQPSVLPESLYQDFWIGSAAQTLLQRKPPHIPWFLQVNFAGPHNPLDPLPDMLNLTEIEPLPPQERMKRFYAAELEYLDRRLGALLQFLQDTGEYETTVICVSSDHGDMLGDRHQVGKKRPWEGDLRVPLICSGLGIQKGVSIHVPVTTMDLAATFLDYAQIARPPWMEAKSLRPFLEGFPVREIPEEAPVITSGYLFFRIVIQQEENTLWKLIQKYPPHWGSVGAPRYHLFNLTADPHETHPVTGHFPKKVAQLKKKLPFCTTCFLPYEMLWLWGSAVFLGMIVLGIGGGTWICFRSL